MYQRKFKNKTQFINPILNVHQLDKFENAVYSIHS